MKANRNPTDIFLEKRADIKEAKKRVDDTSGLWGLVARASLILANRAYESSMRHVDMDSPELRPGIVSTEPINSDGQVNLGIRTSDGTIIHHTVYTVPLVEPGS